MKIKIFQFLSLILMMLVTGVFWGTWFTLTRSIESFTPAAYLAIGQTIIANIGIPMRILMPGALLSMVILLRLMPDRKNPAFYLILFSFLLILATTMITVCIEVPIDFQIKNWTINTLPANWERIRKKWELFHSMRTFISVASFALLASGCIKLTFNS